MKYLSALSIFSLLVLALLLNKDDVLIQEESIINPEPIKNTLTDTNSQFVKQEEIDDWFEKDVSISDIALALPQSLLNSVMPALPLVDKNGNLILSIQLKNFYDFYLSATGEIPIESIITLCQQHLSQLPEIAAQQAIDIFKKYLSSINATAEYKINYSNQSDNKITDHVGLAKLSNTAQEIRRSHLGEETYQAFYGKQDNYDQFMLTKMAIMSNQDLTQIEKQQKINDSLSEAPEWLQSSLNQANILNQGQTTPTYTEAQKQRLSALNTKRQEWELRIQDYQREKSNLMQSDQHTEKEKEQLLDDIRQQNFNQQEIARIKNIDMSLSKK